MIKSLTSLGWNTISPLLLFAAIATAWFIAWKWYLLLKTKWKIWILLLQKSSTYTISSFSVCWKTSHCSTISNIAAEPLAQFKCYATLRTRIYTLRYYPKSTSVNFTCIFIYCYTYIGIKIYRSMNFISVWFLCSQIFLCLWWLQWFNCLTTTFTNKPILPRIKRRCKTTIATK